MASAYLLRNWSVFFNLPIYVYYPSINRIVINNISTNYYYFLSKKKKDSAPTPVITIPLNFDLFSFYTSNNQNIATRYSILHLASFIFFIAFLISTIKREKIKKYPPVSPSRSRSIPIFRFDARSYNRSLVSTRSVIHNFHPEFETFLIDGGSHHRPVHEYPLRVSSLRNRPLAAGNRPLPAVAFFTSREN